ncbi:hypothetical protein LJR267_000315 [Paraburkholderia hospita]|jgi:hypothetical protein|uniref:hypothetical protein n=1 Tax=Paraburkholderia hospita TaxID=169430 RepID=UPI003ED125BC
MSAKVYTGFKFVTHQMRNIAVTMEAVKSGIEQLQRRPLSRCLCEHSCFDARPDATGQALTGHGDESNHASRHPMLVDWLVQKREVTIR